MTDPILVTGATGIQGNAVARALLARGYPVRALTRDPGKPAAQLLRALGAEVVAGEFADPVSLRAAAAGSSAVFAMGTPFEAGHAAETEQAIAVLDAAAEAGTGHLVYSSVASAPDGTGVPHFESKAAVERHLANLPLPWTVLAPAAFLENLLGPRSLTGLAQGVHSFLLLPGETAVQQVAIADLADFATLVIADRERFAGRRVELASVECSGQQIADALGRRLGHPVRYQQAPPDGADDDLAKMTAYLQESGYHVNIAALRAEYPGIGWHGLDDWVAEQDWTAARAA